MPLGAELETGLLAVLLGLLFIGPGRFSVDAAMGMESTVEPVGSERRTLVTH